MKVNKLKLNFNKMEAFLVKAIQLLLDGAAFLHAIKLITGLWKLITLYPFS